MRRARGAQKRLRELAMAKLHRIAFDEPLGARLARGPGDGISFYWLGQAGFVVDADGRRIVIDPYLSDSLARKYRDTPFSHQRMVPAPAGAEDLGHVDLVLCTHHHTDHMDGETLALLAARLPDLKFVIPAASQALAMDRIGVGQERLVTVDAGQQLDITGIAISVLRAAHETLEHDEQGRHKFLGYGLDVGVRLFHSGDTIPFDGQDDEVRAFAPDIALLPVNGRSEALKQAGFAGNFTLDEAMALCARCGIGTMIAHHYGLFAFNTLAPEIIDAATPPAGLRLQRALFQMEFRVEVD
jgi:L-ascorbate metabolism protein UlaG (beta-lactamase superfamily)